MDQAKAFRRLRIAAILAVCVVAAVAVVQGLLIIWRLQTASKVTGVVDASGYRRYAVSSVMYRAERVNGTGGVAALRAAVEEMTRAQNALDDLTGPARDLYLRFTSDAEMLEHDRASRRPLADLRAVGPQLVALYDARTLAYVQRDNAARRLVFSAALTYTGIMLVVLGVLYFYVLRPATNYAAETLLVLEERRERFAAMFDNSSEMMAIYDLQGNVVRGNAAATRVLGFGASAVGRHFRRHVAPDSLAEVERRFTSACEGVASEFEATFLDAKEERVPVLASLSPITVRGKVVGVVGSAADVTALRRSEEALVRSREHFRALFENSPSAIVEFSADGRIRAINRQFEVMTGYNAQDLAGRHFDVLVTPGRLSLATARIREMQSGSTRVFEGWFLCKDGTEVLAEITPIPIFSGGELEGMFMRCRDLTTEHALSNRLSNGDERLHGLYRLVSSSADVGLMIDEALSFGVRALQMPYGYVTRLTGTTLTIMHRYGPGDLLPIGFQMEVTASIGRRLANSPRALGIEDLTVEPYASELRGRGLPWKSYIGSRIVVDNVPYGGLIFLDEAPRAKPFETADLDFIDLMSGLIGSGVAREIRQEQLEQFAASDPLTGLPNRRTLAEHVRSALRDAQRNNTRFAIHYIDLDKFKPINDRYGHAIGDEVLCETARRLAGIIRGRDFLARIGGDEFVAVQSTIEDEADVAQLARRFEDALAGPITLSNGERVTVGASLGSSMYPQDGSDFRQLLRVADVSMLVEKQGRTTQRSS